MEVHADEVPVDVAVVEALVAEQCPQWAGLSLSPAGAGTDNTMYRLGDDLLVRLPRTPDKTAALHKERRWLPRLAPLLATKVPEPVHAGRPTAAFPLPWSVYRWIEGQEAGRGGVEDWERFGADLAAFVEGLHQVDLMGATGEGDLAWYRGGHLRACDEWVGRYLRDCREIASDALDVDTLERLWNDGIRLPESSADPVWLHGDLKPTNLLVAQGRLRAVIDFGGLSIGLPDAEHATTWDLPPRARQAYRDRLDLDEATWTRARAWAVAVGVSGVVYYHRTFPAFVTECRARLQQIIDDGR